MVPGGGVWCTISIILTRYGFSVASFCTCCTSFSACSLLNRNMGFVLVDFNLPPPPPPSPPGVNFGASWLLLVVVVLLVLLLLPVVDDEADAKKHKANATMAESCFRVDWD